MKFILAAIALSIGCDAYAVDQVPVVFHERFECIGALDRSDHCFLPDGSHRSADPVDLSDGPVTLDRLLGRPADDIVTEVYGGTRSIAGEFPTAGWIGNCTGNLASEGRDVLYTASHCVYDGKRISFAHRGSGGNYSATCWRHPRYNTRTIYNDWALCKLDSPIDASATVAQVDLQSPAIGAVMVLNGLGAPTAGTAHQWGKAAVRRISGQDIVTCGPANLGGGDSGGSLFADVTDRKAGPFFILGVNSRGGGGCSYFNRNSHEEFRAWAVQFEQAKGVKICGVSADCLTPPDPIDCPALYMELSDCIVDAPNAPYNKRQSCSEKYESFRSCIRQ